MPTRKPRTKWDVAPARGSYDWILRDIHDELQRLTPPPPPTPPPDPPKPPRVRIELELVQRRPPQRAAVGSRFGTVVVWLIVIAAVLVALAGCAAAAHAQPSSWQSYREGFMTRYQGTDGQGGQWTGSSYQQGFTTFSEFNGPHGEQQHCRSWQQGWQTFTECDQ